MSKDKKKFTKRKKTILKKDNLAEDKVIKSLEKKLKFKKKCSKSVPKAFIADGLDYLLDVCDEETRKTAVESEKRLTLNPEDMSDISDSDINLESNCVNKKKLNDKRKESNSKFKIQSNSQSEDSNSESEDTESGTNYKFQNQNELSDFDEIESNSGDDVKTKSLIRNKSDNRKNKSGAIKNKKDIKEKVLSFSEDESNSDSSNQEELWEDIYGRQRKKDGSIILANKQKYITPALRSKEFEITPEKGEKLLLLRRQLKGILNRLAESNMHTIISQLDELYMHNSRNDMNDMLSKLMFESIVAPVLTAERLVHEHMMCIAVLHANVDTQVGAHFIMVLIKKFDEMIKQSLDVENKEFDNLILMISSLYNFKIFGSQLLYQIFEKLIQKFNEKEIEIILLILKTAGFRLRKDDPLALKKLILDLQQKSATVKSGNSRVQFMLQVVLAIKNNNMNKIPQYDQSHIEHLKKLLKTMIRKGNSISQLNLSLEDLLNADEKGKWWIVGSAWTGKSNPSTTILKNDVNKVVYSQKILDLARAQRMNTDVRKNIFCILMTAEDYLDAFEKLHHLGLKERQEREIIYVILNCCVQEQQFNPYYAVLLQKFCEFDRKYQMTIQYTLWDKLKILNDYNKKQILNLAKLLSYLFIQKALPISILKVIELGELDPATMKLFKRIMLDVLLHESTETCLQVFERIASSVKLHQFREGLRLFINYFLLKNINKEQMSKMQTVLLEKRVALVDRLLMSSASKLTF